jgi:hypothetical protein
MKNGFFGRTVSNMYTSSELCLSTPARSANREQPKKLNCTERILKILMHPLPENRSMR